MQKESHLLVGPLTDPAPVQWFCHLREHLRSLNKKNRPSTHKTVFSTPPNSQVHRCGLLHPASLWMALITKLTLPPFPPPLSNKAKAQRRAHTQTDTPTHPGRDGWPGSWGHWKPIGRLCIPMTAEPATDIVQLKLSERTQRDRLVLAHGIVWPLVRAGGHGITSRGPMRLLGNDVGPP